MSDKHPYTPTSGHLVQVINHFRNSFPSTVSAETLKKLGFAPNNESYIINILRFLHLIDEEGKKSELASKVFSLTENAAFSQQFGNLVLTAYKDLFDLRGDGAWELDNNGLITFFRSSDQTTASWASYRPQHFAF